MSLKIELQKDENGNVVTKPITGWSVTLSGHPKPANEGHLKTGQRE